MGQFINPFSDWGFKLNLKDKGWDVEFSPDDGNSAGINEWKADIVGGK